MNKKTILTLALGALLASASASEMMAPKDNLYLGVRGESVIKLQNILSEKGYLKASARGYFGTLTKKALMRYQADNGINSTGYYGPMTRSAMSSMVNLSTGMSTNIMTTNTEAGVMVGGSMMLPSRDIVDNAVLANNVTTVVAAIKAAGLVDTLKGKGPFTVFAPTNDAFNKLPMGTVTSLLTAEKKADLTAILTYHVIAGKYMASDITNGLKLKTVNGKELTFTKDMNGNIMINGTTKVLIKDIVSSNGVTFAIDSVLMP